MLWSTNRKHTINESVTIIEMMILLKTENNWWLFSEISEKKFCARCGAIAPGEIKIQTKEETEMNKK
jgi:hypothetical protein